MTFKFLSCCWQRSSKIYKHSSCRICFLATIRSFTVSHGQSDLDRGPGWTHKTQLNQRRSLSRITSGHHGEILKDDTKSSKVDLSRRTEIQYYPRISNEQKGLTCKEFYSQFNQLKNEETLADTIVEVRGRIASTRVLGRQLLFVDIFQDGHKLQAVCSRQNITHVPNETIGQHFDSLQRGDIISVSGYPYRTSRGELSIKATEAPVVLAPCLRSFPEHAHVPTTSDRLAETKSLDNHARYLTHPDLVNDLRRRSAIIQGIRDFFRNRNFLEVDTPILAGSAGGAVARAFETTASEFPDRNISLRIAPELWLKRLVISGLERVFEIGPSFRNEGLDKTHNPEFHTCEFYSSYTSLDELLSITQELVKSILQFSKNQEIATTPPKFHVIPFISALETAIDAKLPPLHLPNASSSLFEIFDKHAISKPNPPTLPRLLDKLAAHFLEPSFKDPRQPFTFLTCHPVALSPLSKSFFDKASGQLVAARAEFYINGLEIANMYEEENDPRSQREKFLQQARWAAESTVTPASTPEGTAPTSAPPFHAPDSDLKIDEDYIRALEWGLPPTGGWGCGIDRLVMVLLGKERIADVLPFGGLRGLTRSAERRKEEASM